MKKVCCIIFLSCCSFLNAQKKWSLEECFNYAFENNLEVIGGKYNKEIQLQNVKIAKREYLPNITGNITNNFQFGTLKTPQEEHMRNDLFSNNLSLNTQLLVFNAGKVNKNIEKNEYDLSATDYDLKQIKNKIRLQIIQQYLQILLKKEVKKIADESVLNSEKILERAKKTTKIGTTAKIVEVEAFANLAREKQKQKNAEIDINRSLFNLAITLQLDNYKTFDIEDIIIPNSLHHQLKPIDEKLNLAYKNQPDIKSAELSVLSAKKQTEIIKTNLYPSVHLTTGVSTNYLDNFHKKQIDFHKQYDNNFIQKVGINIQIPIFNKGITNLQIKQFRKKEQLASNNLTLKKQKLKQQIQTIYFNINSNYEKYLAFLESEKLAKLSYDFAQKSFSAGRTTIYDLNRVRNNYVNAQSSLIQAKYNYIFSLKLLDFYTNAF
ncbi:MAG: TolC family protein [Tenacibaculum sp.]|nr:TolC family protein [Tenacibaculum sp.]